ncbi:MAG: 30S ribosome-binding factor RbfA [Atribacterota bacterium]|nr:30S ribosome-binding factor RbfA [Atribacterota bacterium]
MEQKKKHFEKLLKRSISHIIHNKVKDPRIGFVTITRINLSDDLHNAKVYISVLGTKEEQQKSMKGLSSATNFVRSELAASLKNYRSIPNIAFYYDQDLAKVYQLMDKVYSLENERKEQEG